MFVELINNLGLMSACDLISLYSSINQKVIDEAKKNGKRVNQSFKKLTKILFDVKIIL